MGTTRTVHVFMLVGMIVAVIAAGAMHMFFMIVVVTVIMVMTVVAVRAVNMAMMMVMMGRAEHESIAAASALGHGGGAFQHFLDTVDGAHVYLLDLKAGRIIPINRAKSMDFQ